MLRLLAAREGESQRVEDVAEPGEDQDVVALLRCPVSRITGRGSSAGVG